MTKITVEMVDALMLDPTLDAVLKSKPLGFRLLLCVTFAEYQKLLEKQTAAGTAPAAESEPESETDFEPGLCPVAEQVALLTEQVATLVGRVIELESAAEVQHNISKMLPDLIDAQTLSIGAATEAAHAALQAVRGPADRAVSPGVGTSKDVLQLLSAIAGGLTKATK